MSHEEMVGRIKTLITECGNTEEDGQNFAVAFLEAVNSSPDDFMIGVFDLFDSGY